MHVSGFLNSIIVGFFLSKCPCCLFALRYSAENKFIMYHVLYSTAYSDILNPGM